MSLWRNWLARSAVNRKVGGSSPPRDVLLFYVPYFFESSEQRTVRIPFAKERIYIYHLSFLFYIVFFSFFFGVLCLCMQPQVNSY